MPGKAHYGQKPSIKSTFMKPFLVILFFLFCLSKLEPPSNCQSPVWWESVLEKTQKLIELKYQADN